VSLGERSRSFSSRILEIVRSLFLQLPNRADFSCNRHRAASQIVPIFSGIGDCAFWSGSVCCFVQPSRTARYSGLAGQPSLPEKAIAGSRLGCSYRQRNSQLKIHMRSISNPNRFDWMILFRFDGSSYK
jgi:hypothetical protein